MGWDRELNYENTRKLLLKFYEREDYPKKAYVAIALIQLENGSRISEAIRAWKGFLAWGDKGIRVFKVRLSKQKPNGDRTRSMVIPPYIELPPIDLRKSLMEIRKETIGMYLLRNFKFNTHSLRYARITYWLNNKVNPVRVAKITGHRRLDMLITYYEQLEADKMLYNEIMKSEM